MLEKMTTLSEDGIFLRLSYRVSESFFASLHASCCHLNLRHGSVRFTGSGNMKNDMVWVLKQARGKSLITKEVGIMIRGTAGAVWDGLGPFLSGGMD